MRMADTVQPTDLFRFWLVPNAQFTMPGTGFNFGSRRDLYFQANRKSLPSTVMTAAAMFEVDARLRRESCRAS